MEPNGDSHATRCRALWCSVINQVILERDYRWFRTRYARTVFALAGFEPEFARVVGARLERQQDQTPKTEPKPKPDPVPANLELARFIDSIKDQVTTRQEAVHAIADAGFKLNTTRSPNRTRHIPRMLRTNGLPNYLQWFYDLS